MRRKRRRKNKIGDLRFRAKTIILSSILLIALIISPFTKPLNVNFLSGSIKSANASDYNEGEVKLNKSAVKSGDGSYDITFDVSGKIQEIDPKQADIVVVIDSSGSMNWDSSGQAAPYNNSRIKAVKDSVKTLAKELLEDTSINKNGNIRIAVASFAKNAAINQDFTSNIQSINDAVGDQYSGIRANEGTNTEAGIKIAGKLLDKSKEQRADAMRFTIMFTDGLPTYYLAGKDDTEGNVEGPGGASPDPCFGYAQEEYNRVIGGITNLGGIGEDYYYEYYYDLFGNPYREKIDCKYEDKTVAPSKGRHYDSKFYSVGFTSDNKTNNDMMVKFLSSTQNVIEKDKFENKYCTGSTGAISSIFKDITSQIKQSISSIADNAVITDTVSDQFVIPSEVEKTIKVSINGKQITDPEVVGSIVKSHEGQNIVLDLSKVPQEPGDDGIVKISVTFTVNVKDNYYSGKDIPTNSGDAVLNYTDPKTKEQKSVTVKSPVVNIDPVSGSVNIQKSVNLNGMSKADKTAKDFPIYIQRAKGSDGYIEDGVNNKVEEYGFKVSPDSAGTMNFYLRGNITDVKAINNASDKSINYITAGTYKVYERVPMDYSKVSIQYSYDNKEWKDGDTFEITKKNNKVYIRVTNKLVNNTYWRDSSNSQNEFELKK